jgi:hypothetical protein
VVTPGLDMTSYRYINVDCETQATKGGK